MDLSNSSSSQPNALLVVDNADDREVFKIELEVMGFTVYDTTSHDQALELFLLRDYSIVLIHVGRSQFMSLELCRVIRAASTVPIIMMRMERRETIDEEMCLSAGADDYVTKPIQLRILTSRISQQLKRGESQRSSRATILSWGVLSMDLKSHEFAIDGVILRLTNTEYQFMQLLMENPRRVFSREQVLNAIGVTRGIGSDHLVDSHASRLRTKIRKAGGPEVIETVRSVGFRLSASN